MEADNEESKTLPEEQEATPDLENEQINQMELIN